MYVLMVVACTSLCYRGDGQPIVATNMFLSLVLQGLLMQHMTMHMMFYTASGLIYSPFDNRLLMFNLLACLFVWIFSANVDTFRCLVSLVTITSICQAYYIFSIIRELCGVLAIHCFTVLSEEEKAEKAEKISLLEGGSKCVDEEN